MVDSNVILGIIGIVATIAGGWAYWAKRRADAHLATAQADLSRIEVELHEVKNEGTRFDQMMDLLQTQIKVNQSFTSLIQEQAKLDESNYKTVVRVIDRVNSELHGEITASRDTVIKRIDALPGQIAAENQPVIQLATEVVRWADDLRKKDEERAQQLTAVNERLAHLEAVKHVRDDDLPTATDVQGDQRFPDVRESPLQTQSILRPAGAPAGAVTGAAGGG